MAYFKNLIADSILKVHDEDAGDFRKYPDTYAECDEEGNLIEVKAPAPAPVSAPKKAIEPEDKETIKEEPKADSKPSKTVKASENTDGVQER